MAPMTGVPSLPTALGVAIVMGFVYHMSATNTARTEQLERELSLIATSAAQAESALRELKLAAEQHKDIHTQHDALHEREALTARERAKAHVDAQERLRGEVASVQSRVIELYKRDKHQQRGSNGNGDAQLAAAATQAAAAAAAAAAGTAAQATATQAAQCKGDGCKIWTSVDVAPVQAHYAAIMKQQALWRCAEGANMGRVPPGYDWPKHVLQEQSRKHFCEPSAGTGEPVDSRQWTKARGLFALTTIPGRVENPGLEKVVRSLLENHPTWPVYVLSLLLCCCPRLSTPFTRSDCSSEPKRALVLH
jgi:hypothetical protein